MFTIIIQNRWVQLLSLIVILAFAGCKGDPPLESGSFELSFIPTVGSQDFEAGQTFANNEGRQYQVDLFLMYVADITIVKENGDEFLLSEINLFDLVVGGPAKRTTHGAGAYKVFEELEIGNYKGVKFGIGVPDRLNTEPADYAVDHPLSVGNQMYWSWRTGYKYISLEGYIDNSPDMNGTTLDHPIGYHTGKDSINSANSIYRTVSFLEAEHAFTIQTGQEYQFQIELDINRLFYNETETIDMVTENISHSVPGEQFDLSTRITDNLVNGAMKKK